MIYEVVIPATELDPYDFIHVRADEDKLLTNGEVVVEELYFSKNNPMDEWWEIDKVEE